MTATHRPAAQSPMVPVEEDRPNGPAPFAPADATEELKEQIAVAVAGISAYSKIESDEASVRAAGLRNMLLGLKNQAEKCRVSEKDPHLSAAKAVDTKWQPLVREAEAGANKVRSAMAAWEDIKREAAQKAAAEAARKAEQHKKDSEWAAAGGEPAPQAPPPVASNAPAPSTQIRPTFGKAAAVTTVNVITDIDIDKAIASIRNRPEFREMLMELVGKLHKAGIFVDGLVIEQKAAIK